MATSRQAVKVQKTIMQRNVLCTLLQEDAISDTNLRLQQWQGVVNVRQLMDSTLNEVRQVATMHSRQAGVFAVSMSIFMCLAPAEVTQYVAACLYQYGPRSSAQVYP